LVSGGIKSESAPSKSAVENLRGYMMSDIELMRDELVDEIESVANFMRGMSMDVTIAPHVKEALAERIKRLDDVVSQYS